MRSRGRRTTRGAWRTTRIAARCPAPLVALLATLALFLGSVAHGHAASTTRVMTTASAVTTQTGIPTEHRTTAAAHLNDCPAGDVCCGPVTHGVWAVPAAPTQSQPVALPRMPRLPRPPTASSGYLAPVPTGRAPDLHVLQVQRT